MHVKKKLLLIAAIFIFSSCAGVGVRPDAQSEFDLGLALFNRGKYEEAIPHLERATEIDTDFARAYLYLGRSYLNLSRWLEAIPPLRTAFRLSPDESKKEVVNILVDALFGAALSELNKGNFLTSVAFLREVLELKPQSVEARNELVVALVALGAELLSEGKALEAIAAYTEAVELSPNNLDAYLGLARALFKNGELLKALLAVGNAIKIDPTNEEAQSLFREIQGR